MQKKKMSVIAILFVMPVLCAYGQMPDVQRIVENAVIPFKALSFESAEMVAIETRGRNESTTIYHTQTTRTVGGAEIIFEIPKRGQVFTLKTQNGEFESPAVYVRRRGSREESINTQNPGAVLPNIGLQFADVRDYLLVGELEYFDHTLVSSESNDTEECNIVHARPKTSYVYYSHKEMRICDNRITEVKYFNEGGHVIKTIIFSEFVLGSGDAWYRPQQIEVHDVLNRRKVLISFNYLKFGEPITLSDASTRKGG